MAPSVLECPNSCADPNVIMDQRAIASCLDLTHDLVRQRTDGPAPAKYPLQIHTSARSHESHLIKCLCRSGNVSGRREVRSSTWRRRSSHSPPILSLYLENHMETTTFGNVPNTLDSSSNNDGVLSKTTAGAHAAVNSVAEAADVAARKAKPAIDQVAAMAHQVVEKAAASAAPAADWLGEQGESLNATQKKLVSDTSAYIAANPLMSVGVAVLAGFLISRMIRS